MVENQKDPAAVVRDLLRARRGHYRFESGYHGEVWLELDLLFLDPKRLAPAVRDLARRLRPHRVEAIVGPLVGGAFLAQMVASELDARFAYSKAQPPDPHAVLYGVAYHLPEELVPHLAGRRVAIVDDVLNAGSATRGTLTALRKVGAVPVVVGALLVLGDIAHEFLTENDLTLESVARLPNNLWKPEDCPLCARGVAVEG